DSIKDVEQLISNKALETAEFKPLGNPQSVLSISSPASVPVYVRRGSLLSIYGTGANSSVSSVRSTLEFLSPVRRLLYGGYASAYQKLISTSPFSILVSSSSRTFSLLKSSDNKSFVNLILDGSNDWAILNKSALQVYTGNSLIISLHTLPKVISRKLLKTLGLKGTQNTGLFKWTHSGYTLLSGRGQAGLVGNGSIYNVNLAKNEELLVNKKNLLGVTVNGPFDLSNCVHKYSFPVAPVTEAPVASISITNIHNRPVSALAKVKLYGRAIGSYLAKIGQFFRLGKGYTYNFLVGNQDFIKVIGPRSLLLQSSTGHQHVGRGRRPPRSGSGVPATTEVVVDEVEVVPERTSADYLNYVTVQPGKGVVFESTPDFKETVKALEKK
ncbi:uncharacterized protein CANTADRAFT_43262, partial [Suhomyces tanzawaensis NRRL Y-17324]